MSTENLQTPTPAGGGDGGNTITDRELFDHANADPAPAPSPSSPSSTGQEGSGEAVPSTRPDLQQPQPAQTGQQTRGPDGKFGPKPQGQPPQPQRQPEDHRVPLSELMKERDARQRLEAHAQELTRAVMDLQQRLDPNRQQQQPQGPETIFDDPRTYLEQNVMQPLRQEGQMYMMKIKDDLSREQANQQFTPQVVNAALQAMAQIRQTPQGNFVFQTIMQSGHPYGELVRWHKQATAMAAIGADPQAWLRQQQQRWLDDPVAQRAMIERMQAKQQQQPQGANGRNPGNVQLPPSLSSVPSAVSRNQEVGDLSSQSLYNFANRP